MIDIHPRNPSTPDRTARLPGRVFGIVALPILLVLSGCGNLTAGGVTGEATVTISGDAEPASGDAAGLPVRSVHDENDDDDDDDDADEAEGEIEAELRIYLIAQDGSSIELTDGEIEVEVDVQGREEPEVVQTMIPVLTYTGLRVVFTELEIEIDSGLIIGGLPVLGAIDIELDDGILVVERPLDLVLQDGGEARILIDLNARSWLLAVDPDLRSVAEQIVANAIEVRLR